MSRERRVVPPYRLPPGLAGVLDDAVFRLGDLECSAGGRVIVPDRSDFQEHRGCLRLADDHQEFLTNLGSGLDALGLEPGDVALFVLCQSVYLGLSEQRWYGVGDVKRFGGELDLSDCRTLRAGNRGARVRVYVILARHLERSDLRPWRKGTWLARTEFLLQTDWMGSLFRPIPLSDAVREELGLPAGALRYVQFADYDPLAPDEDANRPQFYVDESLLARINASGSGPAGKLAQIQLAFDLVTAIVHRSSGALRENDLPAWADIQETLLGRVLRIAAGKHTDVDELLPEVQGEPARVLARLEDRLQILKQYADSVTGESP